MVEIIPIGLILTTLGWIVIDLRLLRKMQREDFRIVQDQFSNQKDMCHDHKRQTDLLEHMICRHDALIEEKRLNGR